MIKRGFIILITAFFALFLTAVFKKSGDLFLESSAYRASSGQKMIVNISGRKVEVDIANNEKERNKGLGGRKNLPEDSGMLFIFEIPAKYSFWMKDMRFPIDIIWIEENKKITAISENIAPETYPASFSPSEPVKYVLEVNAGWADKNGVKSGDSIEW
ncbi:MAG: DUF192 domain-containing protein [Patescibacteria group bacterium]